MVRIPVGCGFDLSLLRVVFGLAVRGWFGFQNRDTHHLRSCQSNPLLLLPAGPKGSQEAVSLHFS